MPRLGPACLLDDGVEGVVVDGRVSSIVLTLADARRGGHEWCAFFRGRARVDVEVGRDWSVKEWKAKD